MTLRVASLLVLILASFAAVPPAHAQGAAPGRVLIVRTGSEPACVDLAALARAVGRHTGRATLVVDTDAGAAADDTTLRLSASGPRAELELRVTGRVFHLPLAVDPCATLPEQVGAAVAGALAPPEDADVADSDSGAEAARVPTPDQVAEEAARAPAAAAAREDLRRRRVERAALLAPVVHDYFHPLPGGLVVGLSLVAGVGSLGAGVGVQFLDEASTRTLLLGGGLALFGTATAVGGIALRDTDEGRPILAASASLCEGLFFAGLASLVDDGGDAAPGALLIGSAYTASGLIWGVEALLGPHAAPARVHRHLRELATPAARDQLTDEALAAAEHDVAAGSMRIPGWVHATPFLLAAGVGLALLPGYEHDEATTVELSLGIGFNLLNGFMYLGRTSPLEHYRHALENAGLDVQLTPLHGGASLGVSGTF